MQILCTVSWCLSSHGSGVAVIQVNTGFFVLFFSVSLHYHAMKKNKLACLES